MLAYLVFAIILSFNSIYALIPIFVIILLIAAAAGLSRGSSIFTFFGFGALMGLGGGAGGGRAAGLSRTTYGGASTKKSGPFRGGSSKKGRQSLRQFKVFKQRKDSNTPTQVRASIQREAERQTMRNQAINQAALVNIAPMGPAGKISDKRGSSPANAPSGSTIPATGKRSATPLEDRLNKLYRRNLEWRYKRTVQKGEEAGAKAAQAEGTKEGRIRFTRGSIYWRRKTTYPKKEIRIGTPGEGKPYVIVNKDKAIIGVPGIKEPYIKERKLGEGNEYDAEASGAVRHIPLLGALALAPSSTWYWVWSTLSPKYRSKTEMKKVEREFRTGDKPYVEIGGKKVIVSEVDAGAVTKKVRTIGFRLKTKAEKFEAERDYLKTKAERLGQRIALNQARDMYGRRAVRMARKEAARNLTTNQSYIEALAKKAKIGASELSKPGNESIKDELTLNRKYFNISDSLKVSRKNVSEAKKEISQINSRLSKLESRWRASYAERLKTENKSSKDYTFKQYLDDFRQNSYQEYIKNNRLDAKAYSYDLFMEEHPEYKLKWLTTSD